MNSIENVNYRIVGVSYENNTRLVFVSVDQDESSATYTAEIRKNNDNVYTRVYSGQGKAAFFYLPNDLYIFDLKVVASNGIDPDRTFIIESITSPLSTDFITIEGEMLTNEGLPASDVVIEFRLRPNSFDFEFGGALLLQKTDGMIITDEDGRFSVTLAANKSSDPLKAISQPNTWYEFNFLGKKIDREIDYDNGTTQQFFSLLMPERLRVRRDEQYSVRYIDG